MKGYLIELRSYAKPEKPIGSASVMRCADDSRRKQVAKRLMGKTSHTKKSYGDCFIIEYEADWTDLARPVLDEIARYDISETGEIMEPSKKKE